MQNLIKNRAAFAVWDGRIAPVFDTSEQIAVVDVEDGMIVGQRKEFIADEIPAQKALRLAELGINTLVCGAISRLTQGLVSAYGINIVPFVAGDLQEVVDAWVHSRIWQDIFSMPGCCGRTRRRLCSGQEVDMLNSRGRGMGTGRRMGSRRISRGSAGPATGFGAGITGHCVCPNCGESLPHERGVPCVERKCPKCGALMTRQ
ncbi:MAG: NifB/NifX family molybdenum-iron cluster-binding protein [Dissulfurispiraceae bacterium]|jgi:predicted Fe-Mo cluster-binding NifX family protein|nr:NifB/NifX family molybdenum-iron cluster-binding protein [Dissulfurispiraceae bacterium]